jgi:hypothetical protein
MYSTYSRVEPCGLIRLHLIPTSEFVTISNVVLLCSRHPDDAALLRSVEAFQYDNHVVYCLISQVYEAS